MTDLFTVLKDAYCIWITLSFTHLEPLEFSQLLLLLSAFNLLTNWLTKQLQLIHLKMIPVVVFLVWVLGASMKRPLQLLSFSLFCSSLLAPHLHAFLVKKSNWPGARLFFGVIGAVAGAALVPLDWARPWQRFPIPVSIGLVIGCFIGSLLDFLGISRLIKRLVK